MYTISDIDLIIRICKTGQFNVILYWVNMIKDNIGNRIFQYNFTDRQLSTISLLFHVKLFVLGMYIVGGCVSDIISTDKTVKRKKD